MKPYRSETVRLFNLLYYARPFFWYGLPIQVSVNGNCVRLVKSGKLIHTMAPLALSFVNTIVLGLGIPWRMTNPVITKSRRFILSAYQWFLVMEVVYFFLFFMILLGFDDILIQTCNLTDQYIQQLGKAVPAERKLSRRPVFLDRIIRLFVWAGNIGKVCRRIL
ncbi:uncharacterized protein LOC118435532 [Folsomia candida]|uniref:Uncharacterized protein n=1 Tax=Folsomia candida TaxID=158441 RepID=A0A226EC32_FOLCA|nr:uncharacterized protein LOC118435532 [Folsomia candida]OXA54256.1 hypothetical protein Fcan01_10080 [Folsomia candida]